MISLQVLQTESEVHYFVDNVCFLYRYYCTNQIVHLANKSLVMHVISATQNIHITFFNRSAIANLYYYHSIIAELQKLDSLQDCLEFII